MAEISLDRDAASLSAGDVHGGDVGRAVSNNARPRVMLLQSGVKAIVEVTGLADVTDEPECICVSTEHVDAGDFTIRGPDGVDLKGVIYTVDKP